MSSGERWLHHSKLNHSLNRSNYQILWPFSADNFYAYYNSGYTISINFSCVFVALLMWFNVVATNIVNHYHFIYNLSWNENIKKTRRYQLICFIFINLHNIQYIIYILLLTYDENNKVIKEQGEILNTIKDYYEKFIHRKKQMKFHQKNIFLIKN